VADPPDLAGGRSGVPAGSGRAIQAGSGRPIRATPTRRRSGRAREAEGGIEEKEADGGTGKEKKADGSHEDDGCGRPRNPTRSDTMLGIHKL
jgi:hypothetical protein